MSELARIFEVEAVEVVDTDGKSITVPPEGAEDEDHLYARARHYELAEKGAEALEIAMRIVRDTESPGAVKELSGLIKTLSDVNKSLLTLNKDKAEAKTAKTAKGGGGPSVGTAVQTQNNTIFVGSSKDLNKLIAEQSNK